MNFDKIKKDYQRLIKKYGHPEDMTGGFVDSEKMEEVILNPTKANAAQYMKLVIQYGFQWGEFYKSEAHGDISINDCNFLRGLYEEYIL